MVLLTVQKVTRYRGGARSPCKHTQVVAAKMIDHLVEAAVQFPGYVSLSAVKKRYGIDPRRHTGEEYLYLVAKVCRHRASLVMSTSRGVRTIASEERWKKPSRSRKLPLVPKRY